MSLAKDLTAAITAWLAVPSHQRTESHFSAIRSAFDSFDKRNSTGGSLSAAAFFDEISAACKACGDFCTVRGSTEFVLCVWLGARLEMEVGVIMDPHSSRSLQDALEVSLFAPLVRLTDPSLDSSGSTKRMTFVNSPAVSAMINTPSESLLASLEDVILSQLTGLAPRAADDPMWDKIRLRGVMYALVIILDAYLARRSAVLAAQRERQLGAAALSRTLEPLARNVTSIWRAFGERVAAKLPASMTEFLLYFPFCQTTAFFDKPFPSRIPLELAKSHPLNAEYFLLCLWNFGFGGGDDHAAFTASVGAHALMALRETDKSPQQCAPWVLAAAAITGKHPMESEFFVPLKQVCWFILQNGVPIGQLFECLTKIKLSESFPGLQAKCSAVIHTELLAHVIELRPQVLARMDRAAIDAGVREKLLRSFSDFIRNSCPDETVGSLLDFLSPAESPKDEAESREFLSPFFAWLGNIKFRSYERRTDALMTRLLLPFYSPRYSAMMSGMANVGLFSTQLSLICAELLNTGFDFSGLALNPSSWSQQFTESESKLFAQQRSYPNLFILLMHAVARVVVMRAAAVPGTANAKFDSVARRLAALPNLSGFKFVPLIVPELFLCAIEFVGSLDVSLVDPPSESSVLFALATEGARSGWFSRAADVSHAVPVIARYRSAAESLRLKVSAQIASWDAGEIDLVQINRCLENRERISQFVSGFSLKVPSMEGLRERYLASMQCLEELALVRRWIISIGIQLPDVNHAVGQVTEKTTLKELGTRLETFNQGIDIPDDVIQQLGFFLSRKSALFIGTAQKIIDDYKKEKVDIGIVPNVVASASDSLRRLLNWKEMCLSDFRFVLDVTARLHTDLANELEIIGEWFKRSKIGETSAKVLGVLAATFELLQFQDTIPDIIAFLQAHGCAREDLVALEKVKDRVTGKLSLTKAEELVSEIKQIVGSMTSQQLRYFQVIKRAPEVVSFVAGRDDFDARVQFLTGQLQGYAFGITALNTLVSAKELLSPIVDLLRNVARQEVRLSALCHEITARLRGLSDAELTVRLQQVEFVHEHLHEIQLWFTSLSASAVTLETILPYVTQLLTHGRYESTLCVNGGAASLSLTFREADGKSERLLPSNYLSELIRAINIFVAHEQISEERTRELREFVAIHQLAQQIHEAQVTLQRIGHPDCQERKVALNRSRDEMSSAFFAGRLKQLDGMKIEWEREVHAAYESQPRLNFLDFRMLLNLTRVVTRLLETKAATDSGMYARLYPFFWAVFPDFVSSLSEKLVIPALRGIAKPGDMAALTPAAKLQLCTALITEIDRRLTAEFEDLRMSNDPRPAAEAIRVVTAFDFDNRSLFLLLASLFMDKPHPSLVLECNAETTPPSVSGFLSRVKLFPWCQYAIVGVDKLLVEARETLLRWVGTAMAASQEEGGGLIGQLSLVFTSRNGIEVFVFLQQEACSVSSLAEEARKFEQPTHPLRPASLRDARKIRVLELYTGSPCSGKSFEIAQTMTRLASERPAIHDVINIAEGFTATDFLARMRRILPPDATDQEKPVVVSAHLNVSAYCDLGEVNTITSDLILWGIIRDRASGDLMWIPGPVEFNLFVELSRPPEGDRHFKPCDVLRSLPVLAHAASRIVAESAAPFSIDETARIVATCIKAHRAGSSTTIRGFGKATKTIISEADSSAIITSLLGQFGQFRVSQRRALTLLGERCRWLCGYSTALGEFHEQQLTGALAPSTIVELFLEEARQASQAPIRTSPIYTCCTAPEGSVPSLCILNFDPARPRQFAQELTTVDAIADGGQKLRIEAGLGLCSSTERMLPILRQQGYVLTPDFALKLLLLNDCRRTGQNVILCGDTGVGKTELLNIFSILINNDSRVIPDLLESAHDFLAKFIAEISLPPARSRLLMDRVNDRSAKAMSDVVKDLFKEHLPGEQPRSALASSKGVRQIVPLLSWRIVRFVQDAISRTEMIVPSELMERVLKALPADESQVPFADDGEAAQFFEDFCKSKFKNLFYRLLMHQHFTADQLRARIDEIVSKTRAVSANVVVFIDEITSTQVMGLLKEIFVDHSLDRPLPKNIFFVGAMNRNTAKAVAGKEAAAAAAPSVIDFTGVPSSAGTQEFAIRPAHPSLELLVIEFGALNDTQQGHFLQSLIEMRRSLNHSVGTTLEESAQLQEMITFGQHFVRDQAIFRIHVSIRDIVRACTLYSYFRERSFLFATNSSKIFGQLPGDVQAEYQHWQSLVMSLALSYYFRMPEKIDLKFPRKDFARQANIKLNALRAPPDLKFEDVLRTTLRFLYDNTAVPAGVAPTETFLENLFVTVTCIDAGLPLQICGPPGCSKTLSFTTALANMKGKQQAQRELYQKLAHAHAFVYQCSERSTDTEIEATYQSAISRQETFSSVAGASQRCVVLLDEAGLPSEDDNPLKVIHYQLDHPQVATVILSNKLLDAAKSNRAVLLLQSKPSHEDLEALAFGCVFGARTIPATTPSAPAPAADDDVRQGGPNPAQAGAITEKDKAILRGLCLAYERVDGALTADDVPSATEASHGDTVSRLVPADIFHLRDFVYFLRFIGRGCARDGFFELTPDVVLRSLQRNFGGVSSQQFARIAALFFKEVNDKLVPFGDEWKTPRDVASRRVIEVLRESLSERLTEADDPNMSFRFAMVVDPTDNASAVPLLFDLKLCDRARTRICHVGEFADDENEIARSEVVLQIKNAMAQGETVILVNPLSIATSFYSLFNKRFDVLPGAAARRFEWFVSIAVGSFSRPCIVSPDFRIIVHLPLSELRRTPRPFLNRFERYVVSLEEVVAERLVELSIEQATEVAKLATGVHHFVDSVHVQPRSGIFHGLLPVETVSSLVLGVIQETKLQNTEQPHIPAIFHAGVELAAEGGEEAGSSSSASPSPPPPPGPVLRGTAGLVRQLNFHLMQIARPESVFFSELLPPEYLHEFLLHQEHFSVVRFLERLAAGGAAAPPKWVIFTRSCGELMRLHTDRAVQRGILLPLLGGADADLGQLLRVVSLHSITSSRACQAAVEEFAGSGARFLIVSVDMNVSTPGQVNFLRMAIDAKQVAMGQGRLVVVIMHFPPERGMLAGGGGGGGGASSGNNAIFLNGWNFAYIDSLGVTISDGARERRDADTRVWLAHAFGLDVAIPIASVEQAFEALFFHLVRRFCGKMVGLEPSDAVKLADKFYSSETAEARYDWLRELFKAQPYLVRGILKRFTMLWGEQLLRDVCAEACAGIREGRVVGNLQQIVQSSLRHLLMPVVHRTMASLAGNYGLESVAAIQATSAGAGEEQKRAVVERLVGQALVNVIEVPRIEDLVTQVEFVEPTIRVKRQFAFPSALPLYDEIAGRVSALLEAAKRDVPVSEQTAESLHVRLTALAAEDPMKPLLDLIAASAHLQQLFKRDFVTRTLCLTDLATPRDAQWCDVVVALLDRLSEGRQGDVLRLFCVKSFHERDLGYFVMSTSSLRLLSPPPPPLSPALVPRLTTWHEMETFAVSISSDIMFDRLRSILKGEAGDECLENWGHVFRTLRSHFPPRRELVSQLGRAQVLHIDVAQVVFLHMLNLPESGPKQLRAAGPAIIGICETAAASKAASDLEVMARVAAALECGDEAGAAFFVEDIVRWAVHDAPTAAERGDGTAVPGPLRDNLAFLMRMIAVRGLPKDVSRLCWFLPLQFSTVFISTWVDSKPPQWRDEVLRVMAEAIAAGRPAAEKAYTFDRALTEPGASGTTPLEYILFFLLQRMLEPRGLGPNAAEFLSDPPAAEHPVIRQVRKSAEASLVLRQTAAAIAQGKIEEAVLALPATVLKAIEKIVASKWPPNGVDFFLNCIGTDARVVELLQCKAALKALSIPKLHASKSEAAATATVNFLPFAFDGSPLCGMYRRARAAIAADQTAELIESVTSSIAAGKTEDEKISVIGQHRMTIVIAAFHETFLKGKPCAVLEKAIPALVPVLMLKPKEQRAFEFIAHGPQTGVDKLLEPLLFLFSKEFVLQPGADFDVTFTHFMVNLLAVCLGCPPDSTHLHARIFELQALNGTYGPGSDYERQNWDCGYQMDKGNWVRSISPPILGNVRKLRLALNTTVWAAVCWALLLNAEDHDVARSNAHFINYWNDDGGKDDPRRNPNQRVRAYVYMRMRAFLIELLADAEVAAQHIDPIQFLNVSLFQLWRATDKGGAQSTRNKSFVAVYKTAAAAHEYEVALKAEVFDTVCNHYDDIKKIYQSGAEQKSTHPAITAILASREKLAAHLPSPLVTFSFFEEHAAKVPEDQAGDFRILSKYRELRERLHAIRELPTLAYFYTVLSQFTLRLTEEEANTMGVPAVIAKVAGGEETSERGKWLMSLWRQFGDSWARATQAVQRLEGCDAQMRERLFESQVLRVSDDVPIARMVSHANPELDDHVLRMIAKGLIEKQSDILILRSRYDDARWNPHGLVFEEPPPVIRLGYLPYIAEPHYLLLTGDSEGEFGSFVASQMSVSQSLERSSVKFNFARIIRHVLERTCGKCTFASLNDTFRTVFQFAPSDGGGGGGGASSSSSAAAKQTPKRRESQGPVTEVVSVTMKLVQQDERTLAKLAEMLGPGSPFASSSKVVKANFADHSQEQLIEAASALGAIIQHVLASGAGQEKRTFSEVLAAIDVEFPESLAPVRAKTLACLRAVCDVVLEKLRSKDFLFRGIVNQQQFDAPLAADHAELLEKTSQHILAISSREDRRRVSESVEAVSAALQVRARERLARGPASIRELFADELAALSVGGSATLAEVEVLVPAVISKYSYAPFMRWLYRLLGDLRHSLAESRALRSATGPACFSPQSRRAGPVLYTELIPPVPSNLLEAVSVSHSTAAPAPPATERHHQQQLLQQQQQTAAVTPTVAATTEEPPAPAMVTDESSPLSASAPPSPAVTAQQPAPAPAPAPEPANPLSATVPIPMTSAAVGKVPGTWLEVFIRAGVPEEESKGYSETFRENDIGMDQISDVNREYLRDLNFKAGHIMKIVKFLSTLK